MYGSHREKFNVYHFWELQVKIGQYLMHVKSLARFRFYFVGGCFLRSKQIKYTGVHWQEYYGLLGV